MQNMEISQPSKVPTPVNFSDRSQERKVGASADVSTRVLPDEFGADKDFVGKLESLSIESAVEYKISRFLDQTGTAYPEDLYALIVEKVEKPLLNQILRRTGGNQVHAARILGINRNTLRKKMKLHALL